MHVKLSNLANYKCHNVYRRRIKFYCVENPAESAKKREYKELKRQSTNGVEKVGRKNGNEMTAPSIFLHLSEQGDTIL